MIELAGRYIAVLTLAVVGIWGVVTGLKARKSPPKDARLFGAYLRTGLIIGGFACIAGAIVLAREWITG